MSNGHGSLWADHDVGLVLDTVEVLMQAVQQKDDQLLAVLLAVALELRRKPGQLGFEARWLDGIRPLLEIKSYGQVISWLWSLTHCCGLMAVVPSWKSNQLVR